MGSSPSKLASKAAATASRRQYPTTSSINLKAAPSTSAGPSYANAPPTSVNAAQVHPNPTTSPPLDTKPAHIDLDARDPHFGARLNRLGPAVPVSQSLRSTSSFPTSSEPPVGQQGQNIFPSTQVSQNPALRIVHARRRVEEVWEAEQESIGRGKRDFEGRTLLGAKEIGEAVRLRSQGMRTGEVESKLRLKQGVLAGLEARVVENA